MIRARWMVLPLLAGAAAVFCGCEVDSASDVQRNLGVDFTGFYSRTGNSNETVAIVSKNTGAPITSFQLRQGGDRLEAIDNHNIIFKGSIGSFNGSVATFELVGRTTAGNKATISGTLTASGGSTGTVGNTEGTMRGTWIEDAFYGTVFAVASIPGVSQGGGGGGGGSGALTISPGSATVAIGSSQTFNAARNGTSVSVTWSISAGIGSLSTFNGSSTTFTRTAGGSATLSATDDLGNTASASIN